MNRAPTGSKYYIISFLVALLQWFAFLSTSWLLVDAIYRPAVADRDMAGTSYRAINAHATVHVYINLHYCLTCLDSAFVQAGAGDGGDDGDLRFSEEERMLCMFFYIRALDADELINAIVDGELPKVRQEKEYARLQELHGKLIIAMKERGSCFHTFKCSQQASKSPSLQCKKRVRVTLQQDGGNEDHEPNTQLGPFRERSHDSLSRQSRKCAPDTCAIVVPWVSES